MIWWVLVACGEGAPNILDGSLTTVFDLAFDTTRARRYDSELAVEYLDSERGGRIAVRLTLRDPLDLGTRAFDLLDRGDVGLTDEVASQLPPLVDGTLTLDRYAVDPNGAVQGSFDALFETADAERFGLHGTFDTVLEVVDVP